MSSRRSSAIEVVERLVLVSWILKDLGWMTTNVYMGFPFGIFSIVLHSILLYLDRRSSYYFYNASLLLWVTGNFLWMTTEFYAVVPSSRIHLGPNIPIGGLHDETVNDLIDAKTVLLLCGGVIQILMYICISLHIVPVPFSGEGDEDVLAMNETKLLCSRCSKKQSSYERTTNSEFVFDFESDDVSLDLTGNNNTHSITFSFIGNTYIVFWIFKDVAWAFGTGDLGFADLFGDTKNLVYFYEIGAMILGGIAISCVAISAFLVRRMTLQFLDHLVGILWLLANFSWMVGEFFLRYHNLEHDDGNEGDDMITRICACVLFGLSFSIQMYIIYYIWIRRDTNTLDRSFVELTTSNFFKYHSILLPYGPQNQAEHHNPMHHVFDDDDDDAVVLF